MLLIVFKVRSESEVKVKDLMERKEYEIMYNIEDHYWWYVGLRDLVFAFTGRYKSNSKSKLKVLDAGCGTGAVLDRLEDYVECYGIDSSEEAIKFCKMRGLNNVVKASITSVPFNDNFFHIVTSLDVLYHLQVKSDTEALKELYRVLKKNGILILNLPSYDFLTSEHDKAIHTRHRYVKSELRQKVEQTGFDIIRITYRNTILFPLFFVTRLFRRLKKSTNARSDLKPLAVTLNKFLTKILLFENQLLNRIDFPYGLSIFCIARKSRRKEKE